MRCPRGPFGNGIAGGALGATAGSLGRAPRRKRFIADDEAAGWKPSSLASNTQMTTVQVLLGVSGGLFENASDEGGPGANNRLSGLSSRPEGDSMMKRLFNKIICADALDTLRTLPAETVDLVVTSPPYNIGKEYEARQSLDAYLANQADVLREVHRTLKPHGSLFWQVGAHVDNGVHIPLDVKLFPILEALGMVPRNRVIWIRPHGVHARKRFSCRHESLMWFTKSDNYRFNLEPIRVPQKYQNKKYWKGDKYGELSCDPVGKNPGDVWAFRNVKHNHEEQTIHPCQFPEDMIERIVLATTEAGDDVVLDPYVGSGTTAVVAKRLGRYYIGIDKSADYVTVARERLSGTPDPKGNFPNLRALREYAEQYGIDDVSRFRFTRQVGKAPTTKRQSKIVPEQLHLSLIVERLEEESANSAYSRAERLEGHAARGAAGDQTTAR